MSAWQCRKRKTHCRADSAVAPERREPGMKFSLVLTCLNEMRSLPQWRADLDAQSRQPDEIVIVDAVSKDGTTQALLEWASQDSRRAGESGKVLCGARAQHRQRDGRPRRDRLDGFWHAIGQPVVRGDRAAVRGGPGYGDRGRFVRDRVLLAPERGGAGGILPGERRRAGFWAGIYSGQPVDGVYEEGVAGTWRPAGGPDAVRG